VAKKRDRSFVEPPIQRRHVGYGTAVHLVQSGVNRFHRIERVEGLENLPEPHEATIIVGNHQNGLMDAIVQSAMLSPNQIHFLTRADVFYQKTARALLFAFNQMPIYRQRDKLSDARERNQRIFEICAERLKIGATVGLFPEGNHRAVKTLRPLRRGVVDMVNSALKLSPNATRLKLVPVGMDYEQMTDLRRRLSYRVGTPVRFDDLIDSETGEIPPGRLLERIKDAMDELIVNIQPESHYDALLPYVQAMRTTEAEDWVSTRDEIRGFQTFGEDALAAIAKAHADVITEGVMATARPEDLGHGPEELRRIPWWFWPLAPLAAIGGACAYPFSKFIGAQADKRVKDPCFTSTFKVTAGMFLFPLYFFLLAWPLAWLASGEWGGWPVVVAYIFNLVGSRFAGWWYGHYLDWIGRSNAEKVYADPTQKAAWLAYITAIKTHLNA
jgi:1-acyl-sn-glycerol-3-phosphate acyltransferase